MANRFVVVAAIVATALSVAWSAGAMRAHDAGVTALARPDAHAPLGGDGRNPYVFWTSPPEYGMWVGLTDNITIMFSEAMATSTVRVAIQPALAGTSLWWPTNVEVVVTHAADFTACTPYTVTVVGWDQDELLPLVPNPYQPYTITNPWTFMPLCSEPYVLATRPANNATNVPRSDPFFVGFGPGRRPPGIQYDVDPLDPSTVSWNVTGGSFQTTGFVWSPGLLQINHSALQECFRYTIRIFGQSVTGHPLVPGPSPNPWSFTAECLSPYVTATVPAAGTVGVPLDAPIVVNFSHAMNTSNVIAPIQPAIGLLRLWSNNNTTLTLTHASAFAPCTTYSIYADGEDPAGRSVLLLDNAPGPPNPWTFTTACPAFAITGTSPADNETNVGLYGFRVVVHFSGPADPSTFRVTLSWTSAADATWSDGNATVTLHPQAVPADCTWHTATVSARDATGSPLANVTGSKPNPWRFEIVCVPPLILSTSPANGTTNVDLGAPIVVTLSEPMDTTTVSWPTSPSFPLVGAWSNGGAVLTLTHAAPFPEATTFTITVAGMDQQGESLVRGPVPNPWSFTTSATPGAPTGLHVARSPPDVTLTWNPAAGAFSYAVYSSPDKFAPWPWTKLADIPGTTYVDARADADGAAHYYVVRAKDPVGREGPNSTMGVEVPLSFQFNPMTTNVHWISLPYRTKYATAKDVSDELTSANIDVVAKWNPATQSTVQWVFFRGAWRGANFPIAPGDGLWIGVTATFTWIVNATDGAVAHTFTANPAPNANLNWFSMPYTSAYAKASELVLAIEGSPTAHAKIVEVLAWDGRAQTLLRFTWTPSGWSGTDFAVLAGDGVCFRLAASFTWTPRLLTPEVR